MSMDAHFFALMPDAETQSFVQGCKDHAANLVGPQTYLDDQAHLTLYVGAFARFSALEAAVAEVLPTAALTVPLEGWTTFHQDPVTGGNTLVLKVAEAGMAVLRDLQRGLVERIQTLRAPGILPRYQDTRRYTPAMLASRDAYGFPFVGEIWQAHLTIASFTPEAFARVLPDLVNRTPPESVRFEVLALNRILHQGFEPVNAWRFGNV